MPEDNSNSEDMELDAELQEMLESFVDQEEADQTDDTEEEYEEHGNDNHQPELTVEPEPEMDDTPAQVISIDKKDQKKVEEQQASNENF